MKDYTVLILEDRDLAFNTKEPELSIKVLGRTLINWITDSFTGPDFNNIIFAGNLNLNSCEGLTNIKLNKNEILKEIEKDDSENIIVFYGYAVVDEDSLDEYLYIHRDEDNDITEISNYKNSDNAILIFKKDAFLKKFDCTINRESFDLYKYNENIEDILFIKNLIDISDLTNILKMQINKKHMLNGVIITDPYNTYIEPDSQIMPDTVILPGCFIKGNTKIGSGCTIGPDTIIEDSIIGENTKALKAVIVKSKIGSDTNIGPFAYIRPESEIGSRVKIGDFVEIKKSVIEDGTKVSHLTYIGDSEVGKNVNFGCGTITVNYDGEKKYKTVIEDDVFIGCNTNLIAPVTVKRNAFIAAGSTITDDVPKDSLAIARQRQINKENWRTKRKEKNKQ